MELFFVIAGLLIMGEATVFMIGAFFTKKGLLKWNIHKNRLYLTVDFISGGIVALNYFFFEVNWYAWFVIFFTLIAIVAHFNRTSEYLLKSNYPFCSNRFLFAMNNLQMVLLFGALFIVLPF